jgi:5-methylcytosine-specific restriction endonuclease McrA
MPIRIVLPKGKEPIYDKFTAAYYKYMRSPEWKAKRDEALKLANYTCTYCGRKAPKWPLEVHHLTYIRFGYEDVERDLRVLCVECHRAIHDTYIWPKILMLIRRYIARRRAGVNTKNAETQS